jgi:STE24 endopeptidase
MPAWRALAGLELTQDNRAAATAFVRLQQVNLAVPRPGLLYELWRSTHPPLGERIDFCNRYRPWERGEPLRYGHLFAGDQPARQPGMRAVPSRDIVSIGR